MPPSPRTRPAYVRHAPSHTKDLFYNRSTYWSLVQHKARLNAFKVMYAKRRFRIIFLVCSIIRFLDPPLIRTLLFGHSVMCLLCVCFYLCRLQQNKGIAIETAHYLNDGLWHMKPVKWDGGGCRHLCTFRWYFDALYFLWCPSSCWASKVFGVRVHDCVFEAAWKGMPRTVPPAWSFVLARVAASTTLML